MDLIFDSFSMGFRMMTSKFPKILRAVLPYLVPAWFLTFFLDYYPLPLNTLPLVIIFGLVVFVCTYFANAILMVLAKADYQEDALEDGTPFQQASQAFGSFFGLSLLLGILILIIAFAIVALPLLGILLLVALIFFGVYFAFILQAIVLRECGVFEAFSYSKQVVTGHWWQVLGLLLALGIASWLGDALVGLFPGIPGLILGAIIYLVMFVFTTLVNTFMFLQLEQ